MRVSIMSDESYECYNYKIKAVRISMFFKETSQNYTRHSLMNSPYVRWLTKLWKLPEHENRFKCSTFIYSGSHNYDETNLLSRSLNRGDNSVTTATNQNTTRQCSSTVQRPGWQCIWHTHNVLRVISALAPPLALLQCNGSVQTKVPNLPWQSCALACCRGLMAQHLGVLHVVTLGEGKWH